MATICRWGDFIGGTVAAGGGWKAVP
jgi:hypothetical protein